MSNIIKVSLILWFIILVLVPRASFASDIKEVSTTLIGGLEESLSALYINKQLTLDNVKDLLRQKLIPGTNTKFFAYKVLGKHVKSMSAEHKLAFIEQLSESLINSYATILVKYKNEKIFIGEPSIQSSGRIATVPIEIKDTIPPIKSITRWLFSEKLNTWQIFDIVIEGVSLMQSKQTEIYSSIASIGVDQTLLRLVNLNSNANKSSALPQQKQEK